MLRKITILIISFIFCYSISYSTEKIALSTRLDDTIYPEERNYFGLFPNIDDFSCAVLCQDGSTKFFRIKTESEEYDLPVADSTLLVLKVIIDNFEDILIKKKLLYIDPKILTNFITIYTKINSDLKIINVKLKDSSEYSGYILLSDSHFVIMTKDSIQNRDYNNLQAFHYSEIYSISEIDYPIIDGSKEVFWDDDESLRENSYYVNPQGIHVAPPEVYSFLRKQIPENYIAVDSKIDFDDLYKNKFMLSFDISQQVFNLRGIPTIPLYYQGYFKNSEFRPFSFLDYTSIGISIDYLLLNNLLVNIGSNYELIGYNISDGIYYSSINGYTLNFNLAYNFFKTREYNYQPYQFLFDLFLGCQLHKFFYPDESNFSYKKYWVDSSILDYDISKKMKFSYKFGINIRYKINSLYFWKLSGFVNYHDDYGLIIQKEGISTRYIPYIYSFGISGGFGIEI